MRVFPLSNWTELDIWQYIEMERIPVVPLYFAKEREVVVRDGALIPMEHNPPLRPAKRWSWRCAACDRSAARHCTGAIRSDGRHSAEDHRGTERAVRSERENRLIDHDVDGSMELKKREGYF